MKTHNSPTLLSSLIDADESVLIIIDVQDYFVSKLPIEIRDPLIKRIVWLIQVALQLNIPIIATAEDIPSCGTISSRLADVLPSDIPIHNKMVFGLAEEPQIMSAVKNTGRRTAILVG